MISASSAWPDVSLVAPEKEGSVEEGAVPMDTSGDVIPQPEGESPADVGVDMDDGGGMTRKGPHPQCMPERAALIKSILNFLKKAIPDATFAENIRIRELLFLIFACTFKCSFQWGTLARG